MNMKRAISFIVFSSASCIVAAVSALWEIARRLAHDVNAFFTGQAVTKRYNDIS